MSKRTCNLELVVSIFFDNSRYPNVGRFVRDHVPIYWRSIVSMAASVRKAFADYGIDQPTLRVISNRQPPEPIQGSLDKLGVVITNIPYTFKLPDGWHDFFGGCLYVFDSMVYILEQTEADTAIFIDPDILWIGDPRPVLHRLNQDGYFVLAPDFHSQRDHEYWTNYLKQLFPILGVTPAHTEPIYFGGEIYGFDRKILQIVVKEVRRIWPRILSLKDHPLRPKTEEHVMNYVLWKIGIREANANRFIKRIWTLYFYSNVDGSEENLSIWHLPAEKSRGLKRLSRMVDNPNSLFWNLQGDEYRRFLARMVGIEPTLRRRVEHATKRVARKILDVISA